MSDVLLARRAAPAETLNAISRTRAGLESRGVRLLELSDSNSTRHGLLDPGVAEALSRAAATSTGYDPDPRGPAVARTSLAARFGGHPDDYWLTAGTSDAYGWLFSLLTDPGEAVAIPRPGYPLLEPLARLAGTDLDYYPAYYLHPHGWEYDLDALAAALRRSSTKAVVVVNPNNPTGAYADQAETILALCQAHDRPLIADEVFARFPLDAGEPLSLAGTTDVLTFALDGLSKLLAAPHLKLGWIRLSGPAADVARVAPVLDRIADAYLPVSGPTAAALPVLLDLADSSAGRITDRLRTNLAATRTIFGDPSYRVRHCGGGWTVLVDVPRVLPDDDLILTLLRDHHLAVQPGWFYDLDSDGTLALSLLPADFPDRARSLRAALEALG